MQYQIDHEKAFDSYVISVAYFFQQPFNVFLHIWWWKEPHAPGPCCFPSQNEVWDDNLELTKISAIDSGSVESVNMSLKLPTCFPHWYVAPCWWLSGVNTSIQWQVFCGGHNPPKNNLCGSFTTPLCSPTSHQRPLLQGLDILIVIQFVAMVILQYYSERYSHFFALCGLYIYFCLGGERGGGWGEGG